jgi:peptide/nickel transport system substrate-binding protein/oligopeptide transport system substrate-binding protein
VRHALALALPWEEIRKDYMLPAKTLIYPIPGYPEVQGLDTADLDAARALLAEAGYPGGKGLPELVLRISVSHDAARVAALMASSWKEHLGAPVRVDVVDGVRYFETLKRDDYDVGFTTWIGDFADPYTFLQMWRRDSNLNDAHYNDADYEALIERSMAEEGDVRWQTLAEAETLLLERGVVLPIYHSPALNIIDTSEIDGWFPNVLDIHPFKYLSYKTFRPLPGVALAKDPRPIP